MEDFSRRCRKLVVYIQVEPTLKCTSENKGVAAFARPSSSADVCVQEKSAFMFVFPKLFPPTPLSPKESDLSVFYIIVLYIYIRGRCLQTHLCSVNYRLSVKVIFFDFFLFLSAVEVWTKGPNVTQKVIPTTNTIIINTVIFFFLTWLKAPIN